MNLNQNITRIYQTRLQLSDRLIESINRRIPLLKENIASLKAKIASVKPEFEQLQTIKQRFETEILTVRDR